MEIYKKIQLQDIETAENVYPITHQDFIIGGGVIEIDSQLDDESINPLENKVITMKFEEILQQLENISERLTYIEEKFSINYCTLTIQFKGLNKIGTAYVIFDSKLHQIKTGEIIKVPCDTSVIVTGADIDGFITPPSVTFIPNEETKTIELEYIPAFYLNVNIQGSSECRAVITYDTLGGQQTETVYNGNRIAVPNYCTVTITPQEQYGYDTPTVQEVYMDEIEKNVTLDFIAKLCTVTLKIEGLGSAYLISARGTITWTGNSVSLRDGASTSIPFNTICMIEGNSLWGSYTAPPPEQFTVDNLNYTVTLKY